MMNRFKGLFALIAVLSITASAAAALFFVYPPYSLPAGRTYSAQAASWWKWALSQPTSKSPLLDSTGANCAQGQSGLVWFLAGTVDGQPVTRSCTIPAGKHLIFPVVNAAYFAFESDPAEQKTESFLRSQVEFIRESTELEVEIDGVSVKNVSSYFERSDIFGVTLPADNIYGLPTGFKLTPAADAGFYIALAPLLGGQHTIHFHATMPDGTEQDVTYNLTVKWF